VIKKIFLTILVIFNLLTVWYLLTPIPALPGLTYSAKSDLPGDTVQLKNVSGYFTNLSRSEVINFYKANFNGLFRIHLNHPPEKSRDIILDTIQVNYLEEFILPFKESVFISGFEWQNDPFTKPEKRVANKLLFKNQEYFAKITIKTFPTTIPQRLTAFFITEACAIFIFYALKYSFGKKHD
jgi:hypothetical protein